MQESKDRAALMVEAGARIGGVSSIEDTPKGDEMVQPDRKLKEQVLSTSF